MTDGSGHGPHDVTHDDLVSRIDVDVLTSSRCSIHIAHLEVMLTVTAGCGDETSFTVTAGGVATTRSEARLKCEFELVERLVSSAPETVRRLVHDRPRDERVSWRAFTPYDAALQNRLAAAMPSPDRDWCPAYGMRTGRAYDVPASKVLPIWPCLSPSYAFDGECDASGLAAGPSGDVRRCREHGLCEVLERDAMMLAWRVPGWGVADLENLAAVRPDIAAFLDEHRLNVTLLDIGDPDLLPVVICLLDDEGRVVCGTACALDLDAAIQKSVLEAIMLWHGRRSAPAGEDPGSQDIRTSSDHVGFAWTRGSTVMEWFASQPRRALADHVIDFSKLLENCSKRFFDAEPLVVDLTPADAAVYACRVLQPHACRKEWNAARPFLGGLRFQSVCADVSRANRLPHPYG
ncbi:YcaO-like family protein [Methylobacterium oryzisoli]|uniref:YcaO-like family protein n=1 Tax=Methylobacterium oryzisoli TaxID=3385502 RepID=UPI0038916053